MPLKEAQVSALTDQQPPPETEEKESGLPLAETPPAETLEAPAAEVAKAEDPEQVLNLAALTKPRKLVKLPTKIKPEGEQYELRLIDDFGIEKQQRLLSWGRQFQALMSSDKDLTDNEVERLKFLLNSVFHSVLTSVAGGSSPDAVEGVSDAVKNRVVQTFIWGPLLGQQEAQMEVIKKLIAKNLLTQEQVDEALDEMRADANQTSES
jgi:hypothetical protein